MKTKIMIIGAIVGFLTLCVAQPRLSLAQEGENAALLKQLPNSKQTIAGAIRKVVKSPEEAISAKFELDDKGQLSLSIYTAEKGLAEIVRNIPKRSERSSLISVEMACQS